MRHAEPGVLGRLHGSRLTCAASLPALLPASAPSRAPAGTPMLFTMLMKHCSLAPRRDTAEPLLCRFWQRAVSLRFACVPEGKRIYDGCFLPQTSSS